MCPILQLRRLGNVCSKAVAVAAATLCGHFRVVEAVDAGLCFLSRGLLVFLSFGLLSCLVFAWLCITFSFLIFSFLTFFSFLPLPLLYFSVVILVSLSRSLFCCVVSLFSFCHVVHLSFCHYFFNASYWSCYCSFLSLTLFHDLPVCISVSVSFLFSASVFPQVPSSMSVSGSDLFPCLLGTCSDTLSHFPVPTAHTEHQVTRMKHQHSTLSTVHSAAGACTRTDMFPLTC